MYLRPEGSVARWIGWTFFGLDKEGWEGVHTFFSIVFLGISLFHLILNGKALLRYVSAKWKGRLKHGKELVASLTLMFCLMLLAVLQLPPIKTVMAFRDTIKNGSYSVKIHPPEPGYETWPIQLVIRSVNLPVDLVVRRLRGRGLVIEHEDETLKEISESNDRSPQEIYLEITQMSIE